MPPTNDPPTGVSATPASAQVPGPKKPAAAAVSPRAPDAPAERTTAAKAITFGEGRKVTLPGKSFATALTAGPAKGGGQYRITYYPDRRHHLVELVKLGKPIQRQWVHETWVSWEPA